MGRQMVIRHTDGSSMLQDSTDVPLNASLPNHSGHDEHGQKSLDQGEQHLNNSVVVGGGARNSSKNKRHGKGTGKKKASQRGKSGLPEAEFGVIKSENFIINQ